jgi:hypothetical protein
VPAFERAQLSSSDLTDVTPTEYRADAVVNLDGDNGTVLAVVVEVQLRADPRKRRSWPVYLATVRARLDCPVVLLVVCTAKAVAAWCRTPIPPGVSRSPTLFATRSSGAPTVNSSVSGPIGLPWQEASRI